MTIDDMSTVRDEAVRRLRKRRDLANHVLVYTLVNGFLVAIWAVTDLHGFFWPVFPILGWGVAVLLNAWDVYRGDAISEERIQREIQRLHR